MLLDNDNKFEIENMYSIVKQKEAYIIALDFCCNSAQHIDIKKINKKAKDTLAENCNSFEKKEFNNFKKLFDKILEIKNPS